MGSGRYLHGQGFLAVFHFLRSQLFIGAEAGLALGGLPHELVGARPDRAQAGIAPGALDRVLHHVAVAAVDLQRAVRHPDVSLRRGDLGHRDLFGAGQLLRVEPQRVIGQLPGLFDQQRHVGDLMADHLHRTQRLAELHPVGRVLHG